MKASSIDWGETGRDDDKIKPAQHQHSQLTQIRLPPSMRCYNAADPSALDTRFLNTPVHTLETPQSRLLVIFPCESSRDAP